MSEKSKQPRRAFRAEFKQDAVDLVVKQGYSFKAAADAVGVAAKSLRDWHEKLVQSLNRAMTTPRPLCCRMQIKRLRKRLQRAEMEREILIKAKAYFARESH